MISQGTGNPEDQPLYDRLWGSGFLPTKYQGVKFRSVGDPVLYLSNPDGLSPPTRRRMLDDLARLNARKLEESGDPEIATRIAQYEMAYRMQTSVPELTDVSNEPRHIFDLYGPDARKARDVRRQLPAGPPPGRARRPVHPALPPRLGPAREPPQADRRPVPRHRPALGGPARRPEAARAARRHARRLGRRVRPDGLLPGEADGRRLRPRPPPPLLHPLAGRRRDQARHHPRRDRRLLLQHHRGPGPRPRPARDDPALPGDRPHPAHLRLPGSPPPPHRRPRSSRTPDPGVSGCARGTILGPQGDGPSPTWWGG